MNLKSPFKNHLFTNYAPTVSESQRILEYCSQYAAELARLDGDIKKHQEALEALTRQRDEIQQQVLDPHRALLHPLRHMPTEILQRIFVLCLHSKRNPVMHHSEAPLLLGRICSRWRDISISTAELWSSIHIVAGTPSQDVGGVDAWLERSGERPLHISLYIPLYDDPISSPQFAQLHPSWLTFLSSREQLVDSGPSCLRAIMAYSCRWKCIELEMSQTHLYLLQDLESKDVPLLEHFFFRNRRTDIEATDFQPSDQTLSRSFTFLRAAPALRRFYLRPFRSRINPLQLPWHQLDDLHLESSLPWTADTFQNIFTACNRLQNCTLICAWRHDVNDLNGPPITLPNLRSLHYVSINTPRSVNSIFDFLVVPRLRELKTTSRSGGRVIPSISRLILRSGCSLERLGLEEGSFKAEELIDCLHLSPILCELTIALPRVPRVTSSSPTSIFLDALTRPSALDTESIARETVCPALRSVTFTGIQRPAISQSLSLLRSRLNPLPGVARLETANLCFSDPLDFGARAEIEKLGANTGLRMTVQAPPSSFEPDDCWTGLHEEE